MATENKELVFGLAQRHYEDLINIFKRYPSIKQVIIFGSCAKNTEKQNSDFDLAVQAPSMSDSEFSELWSEVSELPLIFEFDVLHWDKIRNLRLKEKIIKEGKDFLFALI